MESLTASENTYHKLCFKCEQCKTSLSLKNYKRVGDKVYCAAHAPVDRASQGGDGYQVQAALKAPKRVAESLGNVKGTGDAPSQVADFRTQTALKAPKASHGQAGVQKGTGEAPSQVADFRTESALKAPKAKAEGLGQVQKGTGERPNYNIA